MEQRIKQNTPQTSCAADDFAGAQLGDERLNRRLRLICEALSARPAVSYPQAFASGNDLSAFYEFVGHHHLDFRDILQPHFEATAQRAGHFEYVKVIHDTTEFAFPLHDGHVREHLARFSSRRQGFLGHHSLVVSGEPAPCPLGYSAVQPYVHRDDISGDKTEAFWQERGGLFDNESARWLEGIYRAEKLLEGVDIIHLADREIDAYHILAPMVVDKLRFVFRLGQNRRVEHDDELISTIEDLIKDQPVKGHRRVWVSERKPAGHRKRGKEKKQPRSARFAQLELRSCSAIIKRPRTCRHLPDLPDEIRLNIVEACESAPPGQETPVRWLLATLEPVETAEQIEQVLSHYEDRWMIEEANKALKTGCGYKKRQLDTAHGLLMALAISLPVGLDLMVARHIGRQYPQAPAETVVTARQLAILMAVIEHDWPDEPTAGEVIEAIATLGGWVNKSRPPGWQVLGRGYQELLTYEVGWIAAQRASPK